MRRLVLVPLMLALVACGSVAGRPAEVAPVAHPAATAPARPARGVEQRINGVRVVHLCGTPEEMGAQMGEICGADIRYLLDANLKKLPWFAKDPAAALAKAKRHAAGIPADQMRELRATAKAAGVEEDWLVLAATVIEVFEEMRACAAVAAWGDATPTHETIVGRNLDWFDFGALHEHGPIIVRQPDRGRATLACGFPGIPGVLTGMNDSGLFLANLVLHAKSPPASRDDGIPVMSLQRMVLERCATAEEAASRIDALPRTVSQNYIAADASGALFIETNSEKTARRAPCNDTVAGTNWAEEQRGTLRGDARFGMLCACLDPNVGAIGAAEIEAALAAANSGPMSVMSVVAIPARRAVRVSIGRLPACKGPFVDIDAGALLDEDPR